MVCLLVKQQQKSAELYLSLCSACHCCQLANVQIMDWLMGRVMRQSLQATIRGAGRHLLADLRDRDCLVLAVHTNSCHVSYTSLPTSAGVAENKTEQPLSALPKNMGQT